MFQKVLLMVTNTMKRFKLFSFGEIGIDYPYQ